jgi:hypothetical protein
MPLISDAVILISEDETFRLQPVLIYHQFDGAAAKVVVCTLTYGRGRPPLRSSPAKTPVLRYPPVLSTICTGRYSYHI